MELLICFYKQNFRGEERGRREREKKEIESRRIFSFYLTDQGGVGKGWPYVVGSVKFPIPMNFCATRNSIKKRHRLKANLRS
jgi:hypothetical protein